MSPNKKKPAGVDASRRPTRKQRDEHLSAHIPGVLDYHNLMLSDAVRNEHMRRAIEGIVTPDTSFLDVGAGTGVWAILAAKLGAPRVVAVEIEECLVPVIYNLARENGVADRIEIVHGNSKDVKLKGKFDVIVSELFGGDALGKETVEAFIDVRDRFLAPDGVLVPQRLAMYAVPVRYAGSDGPFPAGLPMEASYFRSLFLNYGRSVGISDRSKIKFLTEPQQLVGVDFGTVSAAPPLSDLRASWRLTDIREANAIATFNRSTFTREITMDSFGSQSWGVNLFEFEPFDASEGEIAFRWSLDQKQGNWSISAATKDGLQTQSFAPVFAFARLRMAQKSTPHRKVKPKKGTGK